MSRIIESDFAYGNLKLEGVIHLPRPENGRHPAVVICHPHPLFVRLALALLVSLLLLLSLPRRARTWEIFRG